MTVTGTEYSARNITNTIFTMLRVAEIAPSPLNPRKVFDPEHLAELAESIRTHGVLQPIVVRPIVLDMDTAEGLASWDAEYPGYWIVAGERRWRAAQLAGLTEVPAHLLGDLTDEQHLRLALIENLQREDLDPIEEAEGYASLNRVVGLSQSEIARSVNRSQPAVANAIRLLELPEDVRERIRNRELSVAHGVALAKWKGFPGVCSHLAQKAVTDSMTSHAIEKWVPETWSLPETVARGVAEHSVAFDVSICKACPFNAYRKASYGGVCLKPEHWHELQDAALKAKKEAAAAALAEAEATAGTKLLSVEAYSEYTTIYNREQVDGCGADCACRRSALRGTAVVQICVDPKQYQSLRKATDARRDAAAAEQLASRSELLHGAITDLETAVWVDEDNVTSLEHPELVALVAFALTRNYISAEQWSKAGQRQLGDMAQAEALRKLSDREPAKLADTLSEMSPLAVLRLALDVALTGAIESAHRRWGDGDEGLAGWYLERRSTTAQMPAAVIPPKDTAKDTVDVSSDVSFDRSQITTELPVIPKHTCTHCGGQLTELVAIEMGTCATCLELPPPLKGSPAWSEFTEWKAGVMGGKG